MHKNPLHPIANRLETNEVRSIGWAGKRKWTIGFLAIVLAIYLVALFALTHLPEQFLPSLLLQPSALQPFFPPT